MRVLVTGGLGFIGSFIVDALADSGHEVVCVDSLSSTAHAVAPDYIRPDVTYHRISVTDETALTAVCIGIDAVTHQAARVGLGVDFNDVTDYVEDNCVGTATLMKALYRNGFSGRFVQASSMVVYGEGTYVCPEHGAVRPSARRVEDLRRGQFEPRCQACGSALEPGLVDEDQPLDPRNVYAASKVHQEQLGRCFAEASGADVVSLRYHNVYGPRMPRDTPYAGVASIVRSACEAGVSPRVFEDGGQRRNFVHVRDVAEANRLALEHLGPIGGCYNIASARPATVLEMATAVSAGVAGPPVEPVVTGEFRLGDVRHITASPALARAAFGFAAVVDAADGLRDFATAPMRASLHVGSEAR